jgi:hypothetical protein
MLRIKSVPSLAGGELRSKFENSREYQETKTLKAACKNSPPAKEEMTDTTCLSVRGGEEAIIIS